MARKTQQNLRRAGKRHKYRGIFQTRSGRWQAYFKRMYLGLYDTPEEAARVHDEECRRQLGPDALTNESLGLFEGDLGPQVIDNGDGSATIHLNSGDKALIDSEDMEKAQAYSWTKCGEVCLGYLPGVKQKSLTRLHRLVMGEHETVGRTRIVHLNGNKLDCRKSNLELEGAFRKR